MASDRRSGAGAQRLVCHVRFRTRGYRGAALTQINARIFYLVPVNRCGGLQQLIGHQPTSHEATIMERSSATPVPVQVVFQGGGAKLCLLMAVCEKLREYHDKNQITITRVAGSSAGAIAAAMLASKTPMVEYKARLKEVGKEYLLKMNTSRAKGLWNVLWGDPYFNQIKLEKFFERLISCRNGPKFVKDLKPIEALLYYTDLYSLKALNASPEEALPKALAKSCSFPFAFVGFKSGNTEVDGGLALNLPVDELTRDSPVTGA